MSRIPKGSRIKFQEIIKRKKLEQIRIAKEKEASIQAAKELEFDTFVKQTAKDMLKDSFRCQLQVFDTNTVSTKSLSPQEASVWAPWSKLFRK